MLRKADIGSTGIERQTVPSRFARYHPVECGRSTRYRPAAHNTACSKPFLPCGPRSRIDPLVSALLDPHLVLVCLGARRGCSTDDDQRDYEIPQTHITSSSPPDCISGATPWPYMWHHLPTASSRSAGCVAWRGRSSRRVLSRSTPSRTSLGSSRLVSLCRSP